MSIGAGSSRRLQKVLYAGIPLACYPEPKPQSGLISKPSKQKSGIQLGVVPIQPVFRLDLTTFDLSGLPTAESDEYEFKSSATATSELKKRLACAVSGFGNSGGGCFLAGVDAKGDADGGFSETVGSQDLRDWADQIIHQVEPTPSYDIKLIGDMKGRGSINPNCCVLAVVVNESHAGPHMAPDNKYYIRAGAHTVAARHFIIDAIWAKRHFSKPRLTHVFRAKPNDPQVIQLGIVALTPAPAVDVEIQLWPLGEILRASEKVFPLQIPVIDRELPFFFDVTTWFHAEQRFGKDVELQISYRDLADNRYEYKRQIAVTSSVVPVLIGSDVYQRIAKAVESIEKTLNKRLE